MKVIFDELDESYDDISRFDLECIFDNKYANKQYVMFGKFERWDIKGNNANGYFNETFNSILECIDKATTDLGICYLKIYEKNYGRLCIEIIHHDGKCEFEVRELTNTGEEMLLNNFYNSNIIDKLIKNKNYTRNVKFSKRYY